jgi:hypothetical protein
MLCVVQVLVVLLLLFHILVMLAKTVVHVQRVPITAKVVADMLTTVGIDRVVMIDLHADQIQGFFDIPVDNIYGTPALLADLRQQQHDNLWWFHLTLVVLFVHVLLQNKWVISI